MALKTNVPVKHYILVYKVDPKFNSDLKDVSDDPCFDSPPSWGICHPDIRNSKNLQVGSYLFFVGHLRNEYYMKGYFHVSAKVNVIEALGKFPHRQNVIISSRNSNIVNLPWNYRKRFNVWKDSNKKQVPKYLRKFVFDGTDYFQRIDDNHKIDQWKCSAIFNCNILTFQRCVKKKCCIREKFNNLKQNYIIGSLDDYSDWKKSRTEWKEIAIRFNKPQILKDKATNRHPEIEISQSEATKLINYMKSKQQSK